MKLPLFIKHVLPFAAMYAVMIAAAILFLLATIPLARLTDHLARRDRERRLQGIL